jgi:hypothetical protein
MPIPGKDNTYAKAVAREAERFARHMRTIPVSADAPRHPEIREMLNGFKRINKQLAARGKGNIVPLSRKVRVGREFEKIGAALRKRRAARRPGKR